MTQANPQSDPQATPLAARTALPEIRMVGIEDLKAALAAGIADLRRAPQFGLAIGGFYALGGLLILFVVNTLGYGFLGFPIMAGFALVGPFAAIELYQVSRLLERGEPVTWSGIARATPKGALLECAYLGILLIFFLAIWLKSGAVVYAMFFGLKMIALPAFMEALFTTPAGYGFLILGHVIGAGFAIFVFSLSVVSFPLMVDRGTDFVTALITSIRTVTTNPRVMLPWGAFIGVLLLIGFLTAFVGLIVVLPVLGHASWHLYRRIVV
jgi:uncharacterized membrane protein